MVRVFGFGRINGCLICLPIRLSPLEFNLLPLVSRVCDLIDVVNNCWNGDLLKQVFLPFEAECISGIPLSIRLPEDRQVWAETTNGLFSIRSAYKVVMDL